MHKLLGIILIGAATLLHAQVTMYRGTSFRVPPHCKQVAILGSTPHPTQFLAEGGTIQDLKKINLEDFLDVEYLYDSFKNTLELCMYNNIDHLVIAYLPAHFVAQRAAYPLPVYEQAMDHFLRRIGPQIKNVILKVQAVMDCKIPVTLIMPPRKVLKTVPSTFDSNEHRIQHYIRTFPRLKGLKEPLQVAIINNRGSGQNDAIMRYLSYEYVLQVPLHFTVLELEKDKFHKYI